MELDDDYTLEGQLDEVETIGRYTQKSRRSRVGKITGKQRTIFERLGCELPVML